MSHCRELLFSLHNCRVQFVRRQANIVARTPVPILLLILFVLLNLFLLKCIKFVFVKRNYKGILIINKKRRKKKNSQ